MSAPSSKPIGLNQFALQGWNDTQVVAQPNASTALSKFAGSQYGESPYEDAADNRMTSLQSRYWDGTALRHNFDDPYFAGSGATSAENFRERMPGYLFYSDDNGAASYTEGFRSSVDFPGLLWAGNSYGRPVPFYTPLSYGVDPNLLDQITFQFSYQHRDVDNTAGTVGWSPTPYMYAWDYGAVFVNQGLLVPDVPFEQNTQQTGVAGMRIVGNGENRFSMTGPGDYWESSTGRMPEVQQNVTLHWKLDFTNTRMRVIATSGKNDWNLDESLIFDSGNITRFNDIDQLKGTFLNYGFGLSYNVPININNFVVIWGFGVYPNRDIMALNGY